MFCTVQLLMATPCCRNPILRASRRDDVISAVKTIEWPGPRPLYMVPHLPASRCADMLQCLLLLLPLLTVFTGASKILLLPTAADSSHIFTLRAVHDELQRRGHESLVRSFGLTPSRHLICQSPPAAQEFAPAAPSTNPPAYARSSSFSAAMRQS